MGTRTYIDFHEAMEVINQVIAFAKTLLKASNQTNTKCQIQQHHT